MASEVVGKIRQYAERHPNRPAFHLTAGDLLKLIENAPRNEDNENILKKAMDSAMRNKRSMGDQLKIKEKFQHTHGLVFKNIDASVSRHAVYNAILQIPSQYPEMTFPGSCQMRSFMYPENTNRNNKSTRNAFPIFVRKEDKELVKSLANSTDGYLRLYERESNTEFSVSVEYVRVLHENERNSSIEITQADSQTATKVAEDLLSQQIHQQLNLKLQQNPMFTPVYGGLSPPLSGCSTPSGYVPYFPQSPVYIPGQQSPVMFAGSGYTSPVIFENPNASYPLPTTSPINPNTSFMSGQSFPSVSGGSTIQQPKILDKKGETSPTNVDELD